MSRSDEVAEVLRLQKQLNDSPDTRKVLDALELVCGQERFHVGKLLDELFDVAAKKGECLRELAGLHHERLRVLWKFQVLRHGERPKDRSHPQVCKAFELKTS